MIIGTVTILPYRLCLPGLAYQFEQEEATALFYTLAGQSLQRFRTLASIERQSRQGALFAATNDYVLKQWNADSTIERALHPQSLLQKWRNSDTKLVVTGRWVTKLEERPMRWEKVLCPFLTKAQTHSTQRERDHLFGGHRRAFSPFQLKHDISKLSA
jgi:hypothetical protein